MSNPSIDPSTSDLSGESLTSNISINPSVRNSSGNEYTIEEILLFESRYENEYDIFTDDKYVQWLLENHPDAVPENVHHGNKEAQLQYSTPLRHGDPPKRSNLTPTGVETQSVSKDSTATTTAPETLSPRSSIAEFLTYPGYSPSPISSTPRPGNSKQKTPNSARVLTSAQSLAMMEEKQRKKREEEEAKEKRKQEWELKRAQREEEKKKKAKERARKAAEREKKAAVKEALKQQKAKDRELRLKQKSAKGTTSKKASDEKSSEGIQNHEISMNECAVCFGAYDDDLCDGNLLHEWVQCTSADCSKWMHEECLEKDDNNCMMCPLCKLCLSKVL